MIEHVIPEAEPVSRENINDAAAYLEKRNRRFPWKNMARQSQRSFWNTATNVFRKM